MAINCEISGNRYSCRQKVVSLTLGLASGIPLTSTMAMANVPLPPTTSGPGAWHAHAPGPTAFHAAGSSAGATGQGTSHQTTLVHAPVSAFAQSNVAGAPNGSTGGTVFNLASSKLSFLAGNLANFQNMTIDVGGHKQTVGLNTKLTAAEVVAAEQVLSGAGQTIKLSSSGVANGGTVNLNNTLISAVDNSVGGSIGSLTIARGVQVVDSLNALSLTGGLTNYGSILTAAGSSGKTDIISAGTILNAASGAIGSYGGGGTGAGALYSADPSLSATTSLTNNGSISSAGNLTISAPVVNNVVSHGSAASISAAQNVNISTQNLTNSGVISAAVGNINIASATAGQSFNLNGSGGTLQASNGNINVSSSDGDININGGNMLSQQVNLDAGKGNVTATLGQVSGVVNASGCAIAVVGDSSDLQLGAINASGDPLIANTSTVTLVNGTPGLTLGHPLSVISGQNIIVDTKGGVVELNTAGGDGDLVVVAGAKFTGTAATGVTVTGASSTGGIIDLTGGNGGTGPISVVDTSSLGNAGNIEMVAYAGKNAGSGSVLVPTAVRLNADGVPGAGTGNVTIIAGAKSGTAVSTGAIRASGTITVDAAAPTITAAKGTKGVVFSADGPTTGGIVSGSFGASKTLNAASILLGDMSFTINNNTVNISTGASASVSNSTRSLLLGTIIVGKTGAFTAQNTEGSALNGNIVLNGTISGGTATLTTVGLGAVTFVGPGTVNTTTLNLNSAAASTIATNVLNLVLNTGNTVTDTQGANTIAVSGTVGGGGNLSVTAPGQINVNGPINLNGGTGTLNLTSTSKGGVNLAAPIFLNGGDAVIVAKSAGKLVEAKGLVLTANNITLSSDTNTASKTLPFLTNATTQLNINATGAKSAKVINYVTDQSSAPLIVSANGVTAGGALGGSIFLTSSSTALTVQDAAYATVSITDAAAGPGANGVILSGAPTLGTGTGTFTVVSATNITGAAGTTVQGTTVTLNGATGVGTSKQSIIVGSPNLSLTSANGSVFVIDGLAGGATVNGSSSLNPATKFVVIDTGTANAKTGASLTVGKSVAGGDITLVTSLAGSGTIAVNGTVGTANTSNVTLISANSGVTTKGAINGASIFIEADAGNIAVGGAVGGIGSHVVLFTTAATAPNGITVGGVLSGTSLTIDSSGTVTTTKAINASGPSGFVSITGTAATGTANAITIGGVVTGLTIDIGNNNSVGSIAVNANVGSVASSVVTVEAGILGDKTGATGQIGGKSTIAGQTVVLEANSNIGAAKTPVLTQAIVLDINPTAGKNNSPSFITQKGNLQLGTVNSSNFVMKVTGTLDVTGTVTAPTLSLTTTLATVVGGTITDGGVAGTLGITSGGAFTANGGSNITGTGATTVATIKVTGVGTVNGTITVPTLNLTTSAGLNIGGAVNDQADNITAKGAIFVSGALGNATDKLNVSTTGAFTIGFPNQVAGTVTGTGSITALTITNFGTATGAITYNATGTGNAFSNYGTLGATTDTFTINATKGAIFSDVNSVLNSSALTLNALSANMSFSSTSNNIVGGTFKNALQITDLSGDLTIGGTGAVVLTAGSVNVLYANANTGNANLFHIGNIAATTGDLTVSGDGKDMQVFVSSSLTTLFGNITIQSTSTNGGALLIINPNVTIHASGAASNLNQGNVAIFSGPAGFVPAPGVIPGGNITLAGTTQNLITFGSTANPSGSINTAGPPTNTLTSSGRNLNFNSGGTAFIEVSGGDNITADPPVGGASAVSTAGVSAPAAFTVVPQTVTQANNSAAFNASVGGGISGLSISPANAGYVAAIIANPIATTSTIGVAAANGLASNSVAIANADLTSANVSDGLLGSMKTGATVQNNAAGSMPGSNGGRQRTLSGGVSNDLRQRLEKGALLLSPEQNTIVDTPFGSVSLASGSVALIVSSDKGLAVYNLHDAHKDAVVVSAGKATNAVVPGRCAVLTRSDLTTFEESNPAPFVPYRNVRSGSMNGQTKLYQADFDLRSMACGLPAVKQLMASDNAQARKTMANMLKTAAIMMQVSQSSEPYALYLTPSLTAYAAAASLSKY